ncbi:MAG: hypothetical protein IT406_03955 [Candidatus Yanofskybacteria bacterium]|nr:hypothetical protein [Candidatus Yanofskybacteria bacterium]
MTSRPAKLKNAEDYEPLVAKELEYYVPMARELNISEDVLVQAARLAVRDGIHTHRTAGTCKNREEECVMYNIRHFVDLTLVRACLLASTEEDMEKAEAILMQLIED